jgi:ribokinase
MAVVGHVEWIDFLAVERVPGQGDIVVAESSWGEAAGGGGVASARLAALADEAALFTALGDDAFGRAAVDQLERLGVRCEVAWRPPPQRRGFCFLDADGERTISLLSEKLRPRRDEPLPWEELAAFDGVYFTGGDADALRAARAARVLVATARELPTLQEAGVELDALVASQDDPDERYRAGDLDPRPRCVFLSAGKDGGTIEPGDDGVGAGGVRGAGGGRWEAAPVPGPIADVYGAGDTFAAWLTAALAEGRPPEDAARFAARGSAEQLTRRGAHGVGP